MKETKLLVKLQDKRLERRQLLKLGLLSLAGLSLVATRPSSAQSTSLKPTPYCDDEPELTLAQTQGPFYTPDTPKRNSFIEADWSGETLVVTGKVLNTKCQPIANALLDFWHADTAGSYDNQGFRFRGHQFTDENGNYFLETILPGLYPGRTRHIHVRAQRSNEPVLATQLYFPKEEQNNRDFLFDEHLLMDVIEVETGKEAYFNFVLD